jgi:hypothetical protein
MEISAFHLLAAFEGNSYIVRYGEVRAGLIAKWMCQVTLIVAKRCTASVVTFGEDDNPFL